MFMCERGDDTIIPGLCHTSHTIDENGEKAPWCLPLASDAHDTLARLRRTRCRKHIAHSFEINLFGVCGLQGFIRPWEQVRWPDRARRTVQDEACSAALEEIGKACGIGYVTFHELNVRQRGQVRHDLSR